MRESGVAEMKSSDGVARSGDFLFSFEGSRAVEFLQVDVTDQDEPNPFSPTLPEGMSLAAARECIARYVLRCTAEAIELGRPGARRSAWRTSPRPFT